MVALRLLVAILVATTTAFFTILAFNTARGSDYGEPLSGDLQIQQAPPPPPPRLPVGASEVPVPTLASEVLLPRQIAHTAALPPLPQLPVLGSAMPSKKRRTYLPFPTPNKPMGHVHRGTLYDAEMKEVANSLLAQHSAAADTLVRVIIGLTTTPKRVPFIRPALEALLRQTVPRSIEGNLTRVPAGYDVVLNIPAEYGDRRPHWRKKSARIPGWLSSLGPRLHLHECAHDWGPATKMLGTLEWIEKQNAASNSIISDDAYIVATDDDQQWQPYAVDTLISNARSLGQSSSSVAWRGGRSSSNTEC